MNVPGTIKRHFFRTDEPTFLILYKSYVKLDLISSIGSSHGHLISGRTLIV